MLSGTTEGIMKRWLSPSGLITQHSLPGNMQEFGYMKAIGADKDAFWAENDRMTKDNDASGILCYMLLMLREAKRNGVSLSRDRFHDFGWR